MSIAWTTVETALKVWIDGAGGVTAIWSQQNGPRPAVPYVAMTLDVAQRGRDWVDGEDNFATFADKTISAASTVADTLTITAHALATGTGPVRVSVSGGAWAEVTGIDWWVIRVDANTIKLAESFADAMNGAAYNLTTTGTGTIVLVDTATTTVQGAELVSKARGMRECTLSLQCFAASASGTSAARTILDNIQSKSKLHTYAAALRAAGIGIAEFSQIQSLGAPLNPAVFEPRATMEVRFFLASEVEETGTFIEFTEVENLTQGTSTYVPSDPT